MNIYGVQLDGGSSGLFPAHKSGRFDQAQPAHPRRPRCSWTCQICTPRLSGRCESSHSRTALSSQPHVFQKHISGTEGMDVVLCTPYIRRSSTSRRPRVRLGLRLGHEDGMTEEHTDKMDTAYVVSHGQWVSVTAKSEEWYCEWWEWQ